VELLLEADPLVMKTGGETTAVILVVHEGGLFGASCGDSAAWIVRDDGSVDDLTADQHLKRRLGSGRTVPVGFERAELEGTLIVGTDGVFRYARRDRIASAVTSETTVDSAADALVELVWTPSMDLLDDVAVVTVKPEPPG
jgi:serine/threonine protein phosphatase PrpC